jgi:hypothetical protein
MGSKDGSNETSVSPPSFYLTKPLLNVRKKRKRLNLFGNGRIFN